MRNECGACGLDFSSVEAFDAHRVGKHAYTYTEGLRMTPPREDGRRCLRLDEFAEHDLGLDTHGRYCLVSRVEHARSYFGARR